MAALFLTLADLNAKIGAGRVVQYLDDDHSGTLTEEAAPVQQVLEEAEGEVFTRLLRGWPSKQSVIDLVNADPALKSHAAWIACEIASERRVEFTNSEGWGAHKAQYDRAIKYLDILSKGGQRSIGEEVAGKGANTGGSHSPRPPGGTGEQYVFAPSRKAPTGHGGF